MIELKQDQLVFSFPSIAGELQRIFDGCASSAMVRILAEDRAAVQRKYLGRRLWFDDREKQSILDRFATITDDDIREAFLKRVSDLLPKEVACQVGFQRTLRLPDDGRTYSLPAGLGRFPLRHIDDHADGVPPFWIERGGVLMPMYQSEALWLNFHGRYPVALKIAAGKINAVTGEEWRDGLHREPQGYLVVPKQPWLDGFAVGKGVIRQFVATPLGDGATVEEQVTGEGEYGGIQIQAYPMKAGEYFERFVKRKLPKSLADLLPDLLGRKEASFYESRGIEYCKILSPMGLGMGGKMQQEIYEDPYDLDAWDTEEASRCFVHLCNALQWREITGENPPHTPVTAKEYEKAGLPWFDYYRDDLAALEGSKTLAGLKTIREIQAAKSGRPFPAESQVKVPALVHCGPKQRPDQVHEWRG